MGRNNNPEEIFNKAVELSDAVKRAEYLDQDCAGDEKLRAQVDALLKWHQEAGDFLEVPAVDPNVTLETSAVAEGSGTVIGRYKLLEKIGEGGMATVYMAEQKHPIRRRVALKIIKLGMDTKQVIARFEAERQALAMMDHPNIAKVLDAGTTETGRPYFVMELVRGVPITEFCDKNNLTTKERLGLFISVCQAVQHAHQRGIIHRDIKPSNVLVTLHDGEPVAKVIDFGIAKAVNQQLTEKTVFTRYSQMIGTPEYMSPEQAEMSGLDIDTRTDVFSLGVLLYELLTGTTPFDAEYLLSKGYGEMQRIIREEEPVRPSTKVSTLGEALTDVAKRRKTSPELLCKLIRTDLDWIVMRTLEKDRSRRYESVSELAADIKRHLNSEPVLAGRPSAIYRLRKAWHRNKTVYTAGTAVLVALVIGLGLAAWGWHQVRVQRDAALQAKASEEVQRRLAEDNAQIARAEQQKAEMARAEIRRKAYAAEINVAFQALGENNLARATELLDRQRPAPGEEDLRGFEWRHLWQCCQSDEIKSFQSHQSQVICSASFSRDGRLLATVEGITADGPVIIHDIVSGKIIEQLPQQAVTVAFSPDADVLVSAGQTVDVWDAKTWNRIKPLPDSRYPAVFSPDGQWLVTGAANGYRVWRTATWEKESEYPVPIPDFTYWQLRHSVAFSPGGNLLFTPCPDDPNSPGFSVLEFPSLTPLDHFTPSPELVGSAVFLSDGKHFLTGHFSGNIHVWDIRLGKIVATLQEHKDWVTVMSMAPDDKTFVTASGDGSLILWDAGTWERLARLQGHLGGIMGMAVSPTGEFVASGGDATVKLWDTRTRHTAMQLDGTHYAVGFSKDSEVLIAGTTDGALLWDINADQAHEMPIPEVEVADLFWISQVAVHGDRMFWLSPSGDGGVKLWDLLNSKQVATWQAFDNRMRMAAFSADGRLVAAGTRDGHVKMWDVATQEQVSELLVQDKVLTHLAFSPSGRLLAIAGENPQVLLWDIEQGRMLAPLNASDGTEEEVYSLAFSPDGRLLAASATVGGAVRLWDMPSGEVYADLKGHLSAVMQVAFTPDGKTLAAGIQTGQVRLWNIVTKQEVVTLPLEGHFLSMVFSPDGRNLAVGYGDYMKEKRIRLWQVPSFEEIEKAEQRTVGESSQ